MTALLVQYPAIIPSLPFFANTLLLKLSSGRLNWNEEDFLGEKNMLGFGFPAGG